MNDTPGGANPQSADVAPNQPADLDELRAWLDWLREASDAGGAVLKLALLELRLALGDGRRLVLLGLLMLPVVMLAWFSFSVLLAWLAYQYGQSVTFGLCAFLAAQLVALGAMWQLRLKYRKSLSLPATRRHLNAFVEGARHGAQEAE